MTLSPTSKVEQDALDRIALDGVERHAFWVRYSADSIAEYFSLLVAQRPFELLVEEKMELAEKALTHALEKIKAARERYKSLPE